MEGYVRVLDDFETLFMSQNDPERIADYVQKHEGDVLSLGPPGNWFVVVDPNGYGNTGDPSSLLCCDEQLTLIGRCVRRDSGSSLGLHAQCEDLGADSVLPNNETNVVQIEPGLALYQGTFSRYYIYDVGAHCVFLVAYELEELARYGVARFQFVYNLEDTVDVKSMKRTMYFFLLNPVTPKGVAAIAERISNDDVVVRTPGYGLSRLRVTKSLNDTFRIYPFTSMSRVTVPRWWDDITRRLCAPWYPLGCIGRHRVSLGRFHANYFVLVDWFGSVYVIDLRDPDRNVRRAADDLKMFFRIGLLNIIFDRRRFDTDLSRRARLEAPPRCPHVEERSLERMKHLLVRWGHTQDEDEMKENLHRRFCWMRRTDRYDSEHATWERYDPNVIVSHRGDTISSEYAVDPDQADVPRDPVLSDRDEGARLHVLGAGDRTCGTVAYGATSREGIHESRRVLYGYRYSQGCMLHPDPVPREDD